MVFLVYGSTVKFDFVLDDDLFVRNHPMVQEGVSAIPSAFSQGSMPHFKGSNFQIYRPAVVAFFTLEHTLFGNKPGGYHFVNLLLYALVILACFELIRKLFPTVHPAYAGLGTLLFLVHPVHTEVVANIKSQDELLATLGCLLSLRYAISFWEKPDDKRRLLVSSLAYALALFSKESAAAFCIVFPLTAFVVRRESWKSSLKRLLPFLGLAMGFVLVRFLVLQDVNQSVETTVIENVLYGAQSLSELTATKAAILFYYWKLLVWPYPLSWDYSFNQIPLTSWSDAWPWISVVLYVGAMIVAWVVRNRQPASCWGLLFFLVLIVPTSNIFFLNGTTFAERFLFLPSLGIIVAALPLNGKKDKVESMAWSGFTALPSIVVICLCGVFTAMTISRTKDWKDNMTLFASGVLNAPNSSRTQMGYATELMNKAEKSMVLQERNEWIAGSREAFRRALEIWPDNAVASYKLGLISAITGDTVAAVSNYRRSLKSRPDYVFSLVNLSSIYAARQQFDSAQFFLENAFAVDSLNEMVLTNLAVVNLNRNNHEAVVRLGDVAVRNGKQIPKLEELVRIARSRQQP